LQTLSNAEAEHDTHRRILTLARQTPLVYMPSHEWETKARLEKRQVLAAS